LELAFLRGDHGTFRHAYSDRDFDLDPTALAMVAGVEGRMEVLVAVWRELRGEGVDPVALADWLAGRAPGARKEVAGAEET